MKTMNPPSRWEKAQGRRRDTLRNILRLRAGVLRTSMRSKVRRLTRYAEEGDEGRYLETCQAFRTEWGIYRSIMSELYR
jgi:hypothetical protein